MDNLNIRKIEQIVTKACIIMLVFMTLIGILFVFDTVFDWDIFATSAGKNAFLAICLIIGVLILSCVLVATMLNISRIANAIEDIANSKEK